MMKKLLLVALVLGGLSLVPSVEARRCRTSCAPKCAPRCETRCKPQRCERKVVGQNVYECSKMVPQPAICVKGYTTCDIIETCCKKEECGPRSCVTWEDDKEYNRDLAAQAKSSDRSSSDSMSSAE